MNHVQQVLLAGAQPVIARRLSLTGAEAYMYMLPWLRLLFARQFMPVHVFIIWDALLATEFTEAARRRAAAKRARREGRGSPFVRRWEEGDDEMKRRRTLRLADHLAVQLLCLPSVLPTALTDGVTTGAIREGGRSGGKGNGGNGGGSGGRGGDRGDGRGVSVGGRQQSLRGGRSGLTSSRVGSEQDSSHRGERGRHPHPNSAELGVEFFTDSSVDDLEALGAMAEEGGGGRSLAVETISELFESPQDALPMILNGIRGSTQASKSLSTASVCAMVGRAIDRMRLEYPDDPMPAVVPAAMPAAISPSAMPGAKPGATPSASAMRTTPSAMPATPSAMPPAVVLVTEDIDAPSPDRDDRDRVRGDVTPVYAEEAGDVVHVGPSEDIQPEGLQEYDAAVGVWIEGGRDIELPCPKPYQHQPHPQYSKPASARYNEVAADAAIAAAAADADADDYNPYANNGFNPYA